MIQSEKAKVYEEVLSEIRNYITNHQLSPGDKLPSERELAEQLDAGRSSVREALRALELLGLIETRRGEGTFLRQYRTHHTVELLSTFILHEPKTKKDILSTKKIMEKEAAKLAFSNMTDDILTELQAICSNTNMEEKDKHHSFFLLIFQISHNYLMYKIWQLVEDFSHTVHQISYEPSLYDALVEAYRNKRYETIEPLFDDFYKEG
ncbi:GntR family transcriptional regulator [Radiobacillus kanasensis]|uniref:FadR/GntR family transcriptional regulator n=1 Tax=Radiobacillus kanasensis TaxID=2844358 RepID=UPI001E50C683|nr:GntR family transcriptional regulator [Radiobacillus kanasensis]UFT98015.1 GntR family transcriptional regulator [Radiobacillus kanasensis]